MTLLPNPSDDETPTLQRWLIGLFLFGCFFIATQNVHAPVLWRDDGNADLSGYAEQVAQGGSLRQVGFLLLAAFGTLGLILPARRIGRRTLHWPVLYPLVAIVAWSYLSILWSDDRGLTAKRLVIFTAMWTVTATLVRHYRPRDIVFAAGLYAGVVLLIGVASEFAYRNLSGSEAWRFAGTGSPNHAGLNAFLLALVMLHGIGTHGFRGKAAFWRWTLLIAAMLVLWMTRSRTSLAIACVALSIQASLMLRPSRAAAALIIGGIVAAGGAFLYHTGILGPVWEAALMGRDTASVGTLTGRTEIWAYAIDQATLDPTRAVVGHGYDTFWSAERTLGVSRHTGFTISEGHNAYLEAWLNLGLVGVIAWPLAILGGSIVWLTRGRQWTGLWSPDAAFTLALASAALAHGLLESTFTHAQFITLTLFTLLSHAAIWREEPT